MTRNQQRLATLRVDVLHAIERAVSKTAVNEGTQRGLPPALR